MNVEKTAWCTLFAVCIIGLIAGGACLINVGTSSGKVDYCRIEYDNDSSIHLPAYRIIGHRAWRPDVNVAVVGTAEDAALKVKTLCPN